MALLDYSGYGYHGVIDGSGNTYDLASSGSFNNCFFNTNDGISPVRNFTVDNLLNDNPLYSLLISLITYSPFLVSI